MAFNEEEEKDNSKQNRLSTPNKTKDTNIEDNLLYKLKNSPNPRKKLGLLRKFKKLSSKDRAKTRLEYAKYNNRHKGMTDGDIQYEDFTTSETDLLAFDKIINVIQGGLELSESNKELKKTNKELKEELEIIDEHLDILLTEQSPLLEPTTKEKVQHLISRHSNKGKRLMLEHEERKNEIPPFANNSLLGANGRSEQEEEIVRSMRYSNHMMEVEVRNSDDLIIQLDILKYQIESKQDNKIESDFAYSNEYFFYLHDEDDDLCYKVGEHGVYKAVFEDGQILVAEVINTYLNDMNTKRHKALYEKDTKQKIYNWYLNGNSIGLSVISQPRFDYDGLSQDMLNLIGVDNVLDSFRFKLNQSISNEKITGSKSISELNEPTKTLREIFDKHKSTK